MNTLPSIETGQHVLKHSTNGDPDLFTVKKEGNTSASAGIAAVNMDPPAGTFEH